MSKSRDAILQRLRAASPFQDRSESAQSIRVASLDDRSPGGLLTGFVAAAEKLACNIHRPASEAEAIRMIQDIANGSGPILSWDLRQIPLPGLGESLTTAGIAITQEPDASAQIGLTGADAALAATGSLVLSTGSGKPRGASLLPPIHIAVLRADRILPDLESWVAVQQEKGLQSFRDLASVMLISGPSRTADIAMRLILGMHGPKEVHILVLEQRGDE